ncbi:MAG: threonine synthase [Deltaproteobacteria bacterium]|jgi:threonine synthase
MSRQMRCRSCGEDEVIVARSYCESCFGPLEVVYDYDAIRANVDRDAVAARPRGVFRFAELLPVDEVPAFSHEVGETPLMPAPRLAKALGLTEVFLKNDAVNAPTLSFKDRVVAMALGKAKELGFDKVGCASTGNLANSVAAQSRRADLEAFILIPTGLEAAKILGSAVYNTTLVEVEGVYDDVNRLCAQLADQLPIGFVNVNLRPFYAEGSKTFGFEIAEALGWRAPDAVVCPMAGGSLIGKIHKAFSELETLGWIEKNGARMYGAQAAGCQPIVDGFERGDDEIQPVKPNTIAKSLAIGNPADGYFASKLIRKTGGVATGVSDEEIVAGMRMLADCEGVFAETAGGVTVAVTKRLAEGGHLKAGETVVLAITGNGLKTSDALSTELPPPKRIQAKTSQFVAIFEGAHA